MPWLREPRERSIWLVVIYSCMFILGGALAIDPAFPGLGVFDAWILVWVGVLTSAGGVLGVMSQFRGTWAFERVAIGFCMLGILTCYVAVTFSYLSRKDPLFFISSLALLTIVSSSFAIRFYAIRGLDLSPYPKGHPS